MATISIDRFAGISPRTHPTLLPDGMAVTAHNVSLKNGKIVPIRHPKIVSDVRILLENGIENIVDAKTMHAWKKYDGDIEFLLFPGMTWMASGNIADDNRTRVVISGETGVGVEVSDSGETLRSANSPVVYMRSSKSAGDDSDGEKIVIPLCKDRLPPPVCAREGGSIVQSDSLVLKGYATASEINGMSPSRGWVYYITGEPGETYSILNAEGGEDDISVVDGSQIVFNGEKWQFYGSSYGSNVRYTYFFQSWVDRYGYESPISRESEEVVYDDGDTIEFSAIGEKNWPRDAVSIRVYKVVTGAESGRIQFIAEKSREDLNGGMLGFSISVKDEDAGEVMASIENPRPDMVCIQDVPGSFYCGFSPSMPKTVCFSDVDTLYSWPIAFRYDISDNIVALAATSNSVFALTDGWPYVLSGTSPDGMSVTKLAGPAACVSARGVCVFRNAVYYVSNQGLMTIYNDANAGTVCANLTDKLYTKDQWLALNPSSCIMGQFDGALYLFFEKRNGESVGLKVDLTESECALTTHDEVARCLCVDNATDKMYFVRNVGDR